MVVAYRNGAPVHLTDVGRVIDDVQNNKTASWYNGQRAIVLAIQRQPGTNTVAVSNAAKAALERVKLEIPPSVHVAVLYDRATTIEESVHDVKFTLELTLVLVVLVIFLFLRNLSATVIPSLALPMSIIGTFSVMYLLGYSLDNLSLMALTLAVGFVVDDAIVMLENIVRHMEMGKPPLQAAIEGATEVCVHDHLDDAVARGGVHPDPLHGRDHREALPRVRGDDRRRDSRVGIRVADAHADAVEPLPSRRRRRGVTDASTRRPSASTIARCRGTSGASSG